jgi:hypothetical protein
MAYNLGQIDPEEPRELYAGQRDDDFVPQPRRLLRIVVALAVMGVFAGGLWFAYKAGIHHSGAAGDGADIPLIRADTRPIKVKPDNPGGMQIPDRDMLIYGQPRPEIEHLLPPPEQPMARPAPPPAPVAAPAPVAPPSRAVRSQGESAVAAPPSAAPAGFAPSSAPGAPVATAGAAPASLRTEPEATQPAAMEPEAMEPEAARRAAAPPRSAPARPLPVHPALSPAAAAAARELGLTPAEASPRSSPAPRSASAKSGAPAKSGAVRLQLGAMRSESEARGTWDRLRQKNADLLGGLSGVAIRADLGDRGVYYRIQTGPVANPSTADRICGELRQRHLACVIVR